MSSYRWRITWWSEEGFYCGTFVASLNGELIRWFDTIAEAMDWICRFERDRDGR